MASGLVTACIPYFQCRTHICRAVESLLSQTYKNILVIVINDGDPNPPWRELSHIRDPRLVRFDLSTNRGPYFALEVARAASKARYFLIQDADDWSAPSRVQRLFRSLEIENSDLAVSAQPQYIEEHGKRKILGVRWRRAGASSSRGDRFIVKTVLGPEFEYRVPHAGLFRNSLLDQLGGYYGGLRIGYDTLLTNLVLMTGKVSHVQHPLYWRLVRRDSLTHSHSTGVTSDFAKRANREVRKLYKACYTWYIQFLLRRITSEELKRGIRMMCGSRVPIPDRQALLQETHRLSLVLRGRFHNPRSLAAHCGL
jgi:glycosyltransferase involved in cell wall biosynthesis